MTAMVVHDLRGPERQSDAARRARSVAVDLAGPEGRVREPRMELTKIAAGVGKKPLALPRSARQREPGDARERGERRVSAHRADDLCDRGGAPHAGR